MNKLLAIRNLYDVKSALEELEIPFFLGHGTLLGAVRNGDFLDWDDDIDFHILSENNQKPELLEVLRKKEFKIKIEMHKNNVMLYKFLRFGIPVDIEILYLKNDERFFIAEDRFKVYYSATLFENPIKIDFRGKTFKIPNPAEKYLAERYGDWKAIEKTWDWRKDAKNVVSLAEEK